MNKVRYGTYNTLFHFRVKDNSVELEHGDHYMMLFDDISSVYSLSILNCQMEDAGIYGCVARNRAGEERCEGQLVVEGTTMEP